MSSSFSANQYESAFRSQRLQNWCVTKPFKERPRTRVGPSSFVADSRGHLLPGVKKGGAWPDFKGTWDLPARIPPPNINTTARSAAGLDRLRTWGLCPPQRGQSLSPSSSRNTDRGHQSDERRSSADPSNAAESRPESQNRPLTGSESSGSQRHEAGAPAHQIHRASTSEAGEMTHEAESETSSRPESGSQSNMSEQTAKSSSRSTERQPAGPLRSGTPCRT
ncbi:protein Flattop [Cyprinodon tularosa]|uniref:protein Flattop n=1 Tax=Cyprinodon tularosa TaxID=77115 RepID=UPI0018E284FB|nr:protein Flattop [Cyprinodon tularosa]